MSPELYQRLQQTLLNCGDFESHTQLQTIFVDDRIAPWQARLPATDNPADRVARTITYLWPHRRVDTGQNALVLLLRVLAEQRHHPATQCHHDILALAEEVEAALGLTRAAAEVSLRSSEPLPPQPTAESVGDHIFITHSNQDKAYVRQLAAELQRRGFTPWVDDKNIHPGQTWVETIQQNLVGCAAMIVVMTPEANRSKWVNREISEAEVLQKPIFPLLLQGRRFFRLNDIQCDDVTDRSLPADRFYDRLRQTIGQPLSAPEKVTMTLPPDQPNPPKEQTAPAPKPPLEFDWVTIPAGSFWMGSEKGDNDEKPRHEVYLPEYQISRVPVTNAQWAVFLQETAYQWGGRDELWADGLPRGKERHPVVDVNWHDAQAFCEWAGVRLPTEAEWEKAARGTDERTYPWGNERPMVSLANFGRNVGSTTPVGQYPQGASPYGLLDIAGNVWEWSSSLYEAYPYKAGDGRENISRSGNRVVRGGSWTVYAYFTRVSNRDGSLPNNRDLNLGLRCAVSP